MAKRKRKSQQSAPQPGVKMVNGRKTILGPGCRFDGKTAPESRPSVSLCMIVKNEEANLADCVASVGDFADEVIIVDTGSTDRTVEIAQSLGATVKHFAWINDFSAARNESIKDATGEWIFWMDADDRLSPEDVVRLKQAVVSGQADVYMCRVVSGGMKSEAGDAIVEHLRLFRNGLGLHFTRALHESIMEVTLEKGAVIARTNIDVNHTGYQITLDDYRLKAERNMKIINRELELAPDDLYWKYHRAASLTLLGDYEDAIEDYEAVIADPPASLHWDIYIYQAHTGLIHLYYNNNKVEDAERVLNLALERFPNRKHLSILAAIFYLNYDRLEEALAQLYHAQKLPAESDALGLVWPEGRLERVLGQVYLMQGNLQASKDAFKTMLKKKNLTLQLSPPPEFEQAQTLFQGKKYDEAAILLEPMVDRSPQALRLLSEIQVKREQWRGAAACLVQTVALTGPQPGDWTTLAEYILHTRHFETAQRFCNLALKVNPQDANALNILGFAAIQQNKAEDAMTSLLQAWFNNPEHPWVKENLNTLAAGLEMSLAAAVEEYGGQMLKRKLHLFAVTAFTFLIEQAPSNPKPYKSLAVALNALGRETEAVQAWEMAQLLESQGAVV